jgi:hypothetical protein
MEKRSKENPWQLKTHPGTSSYEMYMDEKAETKEGMTHLNQIELQGKIKNFYLYNPNDMDTRVDSKNAFTYYFAENTEFIFP